MQVTQLTVKDSHVSPAKLAQFLKIYLNNSYHNIPLTYFLEVAKKMINGEAYTADRDLRVPVNDYVNVIQLEVLSEYDKAINAAQEKKRYYVDLLEKGANGDGQAAIEFCQAMREGKYSDAAYAFA
jgi:hypothetical protein